MNILNFYYSIQNNQQIKRKTIIRNTTRVKYITIMDIITVIDNEVAAEPIIDATLTELDKWNLLPDDNGLVISSLLKSGLISSTPFY